MISIAKYISVKLTQLQSTDPGYDLEDLVTGRVLQTELPGQETSQAARGGGGEDTWNDGIEQED